MQNISPNTSHGYFSQARQIIADAIYPEGKNMRNEATRAANIDPLTGLANRRAFDLARTTAEFDDETSIIFFDGNNFGWINKALGHKVGDGVLQNMAQVIKLAATRYRVGVRAFRLGGDEFVIICPKNIAEAVRDTVERLYEPFFLPGKTIGETVVVSITGECGDTLELADAGLQKRKADQKKAQTILKNKEILAAVLHG